MNRMQLVELEDLPWFPSVLRDGGTAFLEFAERTSGHGRMLVPPLERALDATGETRIVDLCSGGGGPAASIADELARRGRNVTVTLTDLYPNAPAYERAERESGGKVTGFTRSVDATAVPAELPGVRTIFNAFHHFPREQAKKVLADAVAQRKAIGVFEVVSRELPMLPLLLLTPLTVTFSLPMWRPFRWSWVPFTWLLPVMQQNLHFLLCAVLSTKALVSGIGTEAAFALLHPGVVAGRSKTGFPFLLPVPVHRPHHAAINTAYIFLVG